MRLAYTGDRAFLAEGTASAKPWGCSVPGTRKERRLEGTEPGAKGRKR